MAQTACRTKSARNDTGPQYVPSTPIQAEKEQDYAEYKERTIWVVLNNIAFRRV